MLASALGMRGVAQLSPPVRAAMIEVPRHQFVPLEYRSAAYWNAAPDRPWPDNLTTTYRRADDPAAATREDR
jgi:protein-L-isoaspartate O-methyltransferase